ncbi:MAG: 1-carboxy-3-chloro-3,4-dihydroxycyclo hexa-1,5-diene dehydrogenase [Armatimonadota bacterium]|nr:MAG: 1-carboxy-3-chloro-3,4-dihydroxycyclo hexa-1,5-diene dehydrogenase [Armatimonadota bacterium]
MKRIRVGAIGTGGIFRGAHLSAYPDLPSCQLVALCDVSEQSLAAAERRMKELYEQKAQQAEERGDKETAARLKQDLKEVKRYQDVQTMLKETQLDLVDICTQPNLHAPMAIAALEAGVHVMCEKPMARTWLECMRVVETVQRTGRLYQHNENWLWDPFYYTAKKLIDAGWIGEPVMMFLATAHGGPEGNPNFWNAETGGGGSLLDNGIHAVGASWYLSGMEKRPTIVKAAEPIGITIRMPQRILSGQFQQVQVEDDGHILIRFEHPQTGAWSTAHVEGSWSHRDSPDTVIIGTMGTIRFTHEDDRRIVVVEDATGSCRRVEATGPTWEYWPSSFYGEIRNMVECVRKGVRSISDEHFGAECSAIVGAAYLSQKRGKRAVTLTEFKRFANDIYRRYPDSADTELISRLLP